MQVLREMDRLSRTGFILNDIRRCLPGFVAAWEHPRRHPQPADPPRHAPFSTPCGRFQALCSRLESSMPRSQRIPSSVWRRCTANAPDVPELDADVIVVGGGPGSVSAGSLPSAVTASFSWTKHASHVTKPVRSTSTRPGAAAQRAGSRRRPPDHGRAPHGGHAHPRTRRAPFSRRFRDRRPWECGDRAVALPTRLPPPRSCPRGGLEVHEGAHVRDVLVADGSVQVSSAESTASA